MKLTRILVLCTFFLPVQGVYDRCTAQKWSVATNMAGWLDLGTINAEWSVSVARKLTVNLSARYNPWTYAKGSDNQFQNRKKAVKAGIRYWPWYVYSGWWIEADAQYMEYNRGGIFHKWTEEGDAVGGAFSFGYTLMISRHWNMEFGAGFWTGSTAYRRYDLPERGKITEDGRKFFILPDDVKVTMAFTF